MCCSITDLCGVDELMFDVGDLYVFGLCAYLIGIKA